MARKLNPTHLAAYKKGGKLKMLFDVIQEDPELSFEIRMKDEVMVYYHKDKILTVTIKNDKPEITILSSNYYKHGKKPTVCFDKEHIDHNLRCKTEMRSYFKDAKKLAYFKKMGAEFNIQQNIALGNHTYDNRFLVVDMEWMFSQAGIKDKISQTKIDLIIVDTNKNSEGNNDIYLAELKLGLGATEGNSGIIDHVRKTNVIINNEKACMSLFEDVASIVEQKEELGLIKGTHKVLRFCSKPKMMLILAYRGEKEKELLEDEAEKAKREAAKLGMDEPVCIMHNALIELKI